MTRYSEDFKNAIINKVLSLESPSIRSIAKEHDIPIGSVLNWIRHAKTKEPYDQRFEKLMKEDTEFSVDKKFKIIIETASLSPEELSAFCRNKGLYMQDIEVWKQEMMDNLDSRNKQRLATENRDLKVKLRELETELRCKTQALAETSALLLLKKKSQNYLGGPRGRKIAVENKVCAIKLIQEAQQLGSKKSSACEILGINIRSIQRWRKAGMLIDKRRGPLTALRHQLTDNERMQVISIANSPTYAHMPPCQIVPRLADKGIYIASESSFYRILKQNDQLKHRLRQRRSVHSRPKVCVASAPNQVWSWDITYLPSNVKGLFYYLYLFIDIYSRKIVGFSVYDAEKSEYAVEVIQKACIDEKILRNQITVHSDNGSPMKGSTLLETFHYLGITPSYSRPSVSNDNPYSEAIFRTLKYCCWYPRHPFSSLSAANHWVIDFVNWYNNEHLHSGLKFITPHARHQGLSEQIMQKRKFLYEQVKRNNPCRWTGRIRNWELPSHVYLNPPKQKIVIN